MCPRQQCWLAYEFPCQVVANVVPESPKLICQKLVPRAKQVGIGASRVNGMIFLLVFQELVSCHLVKTHVHFGVARRTSLWRWLWPGQCSAVFQIGRAIRRSQPMIKLGKSVLTGVMCLDRISLLPLRRLPKSLGQRMTGLCCVLKTISDPAMSADIFSLVISRSLLPKLHSWGDGGGVGL